MDTEKIMPPSYSQEMMNYKSGQTSRKTWILSAYAVLMTVAMVTVCIVFSLHIQDLKQDSAIDETEDILESIVKADELRNPPQRYHVTSKDESEDIEVDKARDREIIRVERDAGVYSLLVLDYKKNFGGIYDGETNGCYLVGGLDSSLPDAEQLSELLENKTASADGVMNELDYAVQTDRPVTDLSLVPDELQNICWGKPVFWLYRTHGQERQRRGVSGQVCYRRCSNVGRGRFCWYVCVNRG